MAPTSKKQNNPDVKQAVIAFLRPTSRQLKRGQFHTYKLCTPPQTRLHLSMSSLYLSSKRELLRSGLSSNVVYK
eukprot:9301852-Ditylum_brightwellii.AAC.1